MAANRSSAVVAACVGQEARMVSPAEVQALASSSKAVRCALFAATTRPIRLRGRPVILAVSAPQSSCTEGALRCRLAVAIGPEAATVTEKRVVIKMAIGERPEQRTDPAVSTVGLL